MRGVTLGLFDEKTAWEKFENWNGEHEEVVARRQETHRKHKQEKRHAIVSESVRRVEEKNAARAASATPSEEEGAEGTEETANEETASAENE